MVKPSRTLFAAHGDYEFWLVPHERRTPHKARQWRVDVWHNNALENSSPWTTLHIATILAEAQVIIHLPVRHAARILRAQRQPEPPGPLLDE